MRLAAFHNDRTRGGICRCSVGDVGRGAGVNTNVGVLCLESGRVDVCSGRGDTEPGLERKAVEKEDVVKWPRG